MSENEFDSIKASMDDASNFSHLQVDNVRREEDGYNSDATIEEEESFADNRSKRSHGNLDFSPSSETQTKRSRLNTQWPDDVQKAFEEAIILIPKRTSKNIKVNGITQGRNQYISLYIQHKTGVYRTPKQVSSHIQGLCSSKREYPMKRLLIEGPDENDQMIERFSQIFSKIMEQQQVPSYHESCSVKRNDESDINQHTLCFQGPSSTFSPQNNCVTLKKIDMCYVNFNVLKDSHVFSKVYDSIYGKIEENNIESSYLFKKHQCLSPLLETCTKPEFPLITVDVPFLLPSLDNDLVSGNYNFRAKFTVTGMPKNISYNVATVVMIGNTVIDTQISQLSHYSSKSKIDQTFCVDIASDYWKAFFSRKKQHLYSGENSDIERDVNCTSIYHYIVDSAFVLNQSFNPNLMDFSIVKCLLIWNFRVCTNLEFDKIKVSKVKEIVTTKSPLRHQSNETLIHKTFKLSTPLSIIAEQRHNSTKSLPRLNTPSGLIDSPLSSRNQQLFNIKDSGLQSLITPPHTGFPVSGLEDRGNSESCPILFGDDLKQVTTSFTPQNIFDDIQIAQPNIDNNAATDKENCCTDILDQSIDDYKDIFSSPNLQMYDFL